MVEAMVYVVRESEKCFDEGVGGLICCRVRWCALKMGRN